MTDKTEDQENEPDKKKLKGFANPENRKNINRRGRNPGSTQKAPKNGEIEEMFACGAKESVAVLLKMLRDKDTSDSTRFKVASKFVDTHLTIEKQGGKLRIEQTDDKGKKESYEVEEETQEKATGTSGKVVSFKKLVSTEYKEKDSEEDKKED